MLVASASFKMLATKPSEGGNADAAETSAFATVHVCCTACTFLYVHGTRRTKLNYKVGPSCIATPLLVHIIRFAGRLNLEIWLSCPSASGAAVIYLKFALSIPHAVW